MRGKHFIFTNDWTNKSEMKCSQRKNVSKKKISVLNDIFKKHVYSTSIFNKADFPKH